GCTYFFMSRARLAAVREEAARALAQAEAAQRHAVESQLRLLQAQLEPHMLFNTLANLRALVGIDAERAQTMLDHLVAFLRATLSASRATLHPLHQEFARLDDYLALMAVRMGPRLRYTLDLPEALREVPVPPLLLQPLVENSIRHGLEPLPAGGQITVRARQEDGWLRLDVLDDGSGPGTPAPDAALWRAETGGPATAPAAGGFGLLQVRQRLEALHGERFAMECVALPQGGTRAGVRFPVQQ
ncbi:MAG: sensor histidine kinase, partial [Rhodoferax sp.]|nr:sensor histidine kinase [Rhodoferax sp.]